MKSARLILQLVLASTAPRLLDPDDLLRASRRNIPAASVTGAPLYADGNPMQVANAGPGGARRLLASFQTRLPGERRHVAV